MKKLHIVFCLCFTLTINCKAQFYGQKNYDYSSSGAGPTQFISCSAHTTSIHSQGFLNGMFNPSGTRIFFIRKTDILGDSSSADDFFTNVGIFYKNPDCTVSSTLVPECKGISVIETGNSSTPATGSRYALAAACGGSTSGYFLAFLTLDQSGDLVNSAFYDFPVGATGATKPTIIESSNPGDYYICGSYNFTGPFQENMYVLKISVNGAISWSQEYISAIQLQPKDIIVSPFNASELVLVGRVYSSNGTDDNGFFLKLDESSGAILTYTVYGDDQATAEHQYFTSIAAAISTAGGFDGFVMTGSSDPLSWNPSIDGTWVQKTDQNGNVLWNTIIENGAASSIEGIGTRIFERFNPNTSSYTYFCSGPMSNNPRVYKLNDLGVLYPGNFNQFDYNFIAPVNPQLYPTQITNINSGSSDDGFQIYVTDGNNSQDVYFVKAYFDGNSGCSFETLTTGTQGPGPSIIHQLQIANTSNILSVAGCASYFASCAHSKMPNSPICSNTSVSGASNARLIGGTLLIDKEKEHNYNIYPNPNDGKFTIEATANIQLNLVNELGQLVRVITLSESNNHAVNVSDLAKGIYFISGQKDGIQIYRKIIVTK